MPNHITNRLVIEGTSEEVAKVFDFIKSDTPNEKGVYALVDFNKIVPMPETLDVSSSSVGKDGKDYLLGLSGNCFQVAEYKKSAHYEKMKQMEKDNPEWFNKHLELGRQYLRNIADYGHCTWYEWRYANWGTKWNAYEIEKVDDNTMMFQTAWAGVPDLICKLGAMFPEVTIKYDYADEDTSYNVGSYIITGEDVDDNSPASASPEAWKLVFDLGVAIEEDYVEQPDGTFVYKEDDEEEDDQEAV